MVSAGSFAIGRTPAIYSLGIRREFRIAFAPVVAACKWVCGMSRQAGLTLQAHLN
jgi:hypothetical protein